MNLFKKGLYLFSFFLLTAQPTLGMEEELREIETNSPGHFAYERKGNWYLWEKKPNETPVVKETRRGLSNGGGFGAPLSVFNNWPDQVSNASIFPYLLEGFEKEYPNFVDFISFVRDWHQSSCAIICRISHTESKIVGSGSFTDKGLVATARHNFQTIPPKSLYVRFFKYRVSAHNHSYLRVQEDYLDMPVSGAQLAEEGLDGGYLTIHQPTEKNLFGQYAKELPVNDKMFDSSLAPGDHAMFHFAGGLPQVSIGEVEDIKFGAPIHEQIRIQAGPGASGASIIYKAFYHVSAGGISIYRILENGTPERRIIPFSQFFNPKDIDEISAPYLYNPEFLVIPKDALLESGYEFLLWRDEAHLKRREKWKNGKKVDPFSKPDFKNSFYNVGFENHSTHHIIRIDDMIFLYEYLYHLDDGTKATLMEQAKSEANQHKGNYQEKFDQNARYSQLEEAEIQKHYGNFHILINNLLPQIPVERGKTRAITGVKGFAWCLWNLFQGWKCDYRDDDPSVLAPQEHSKDYSERMKPQTFSQPLWNTVKNLNTLIQNLKKPKVPDRPLEGELYKTMEQLQNIWNSSKTKDIHRYNPADWIKVGKKDGHDLYRVTQ